MSKLQVRQPIVHTPAFNEYKITGLNLSIELQNLGLQYPFGMLDWNYYYTDLGGWNKLIENLIFKSSLYKEDRRDCDWYAFKAFVECQDRYGLNTMAFVTGNSPEGYHAFNMIYDGHDFWLWEPQDGFEHAGELFPIGEYGYVPEKVLI